MRLRGYNALLLYCVLAACQRWTGDINADGDGQLQVFQGDTLWRLLPNLWTEKNIAVRCPNSKGDFDVYLAQSQEQLEKKRGLKDHAWCGFQKVLFDDERCRTSLSPFGVTYVFVPQPRRGGGNCTFDVSQQFSVIKLSLGILGLILYSFAAPLSESMLFRLGAGSMSFMLLSALILLFVLYRSVPNKKTVAAMFALFGTSLASWFRYFFGQWIPSVHQLASSKVVWVYMAVTSLIGWAVTYYFDREDNHKLHTILRYAMKLLGLGFVAFSTSVPGISLSICLALVLADLQWLVPRPFVRRLQFWGTKSGQSAGSKDVARNGVMADAEQTSPWKKLGRLMDEAINTRMPWEAEVESRKETPQQEASIGYTMKEELLRGLPEGTSRVRMPAGGGLIPTSSMREGGRSQASPSTRDVSTPPSRVSGSRQLEESTDSPLVQRGLLLNVSTGRAIKIGGPTFHSLQDKGWEADFQEGVMKPPASTPGTAATPGSNRSSRASSGRKAAR